ncbi:hypothetical protein [Pandoravirus japonicus]|uniref:Uncharacterized protein n=1 Tax=Pandoravirus japonicus TaxID=2823154 RepID=A0A811BPP4_9VIRU|nr:hypothetical protein [Pandoravirus japonicus]
MASPLTPTTGPTRSGYTRAWPCSSLDAVDPTKGLAAVFPTTHADAPTAPFFVFLVDRLAPGRRAFCPLFLCVCARARHMLLAHARRRRKKKRKKRKKEKDRVKCEEKCLGFFLGDAFFSPRKRFGSSQTKKNRKRNGNDTAGCFVTGLQDRGASGGTGPRERARRQTDPPQ